jgi:uncharacterized protein (TIGR00730 family)
MTGVCVFCGSRTGVPRAYLESGQLLGRFLATEGHTLIYGGGGAGVMGALADAVLEHHGPVIGVIPEHLAVAELMHKRVADMRVTRDMHERKALMHSLADIYVVLPGGLGTMEEFFEAVTWAQLDLHSRPIAVLNISGLYDGLTTLMSAMQQDGFLSAGCLALVSTMDTIDVLFQWIRMQSQR